MENENSTKGFMKNDYGDSKTDKSNELNENMSIKPQGADELTNKIRNIGGSN